MPSISSSSSTFYAENWLYADALFIWDRAPAGGRRSGVGVMKMSGRCGANADRYCGEGFDWENGLATE